ncbi:glycosyltransferase family 4 protein [Paracoccus sp. (in: a-proteobacteria)]|uniref:glycosyltransferase family 4 protein n=1 Tax=Paracoccus sp. TaxID=267 RepID=UPI0026DF2965|nr:glycosyltransferase family 4 protein [Paracoccus sp. (in: a-proteobacteria)]MDO5370900.1 glycosyltransferase family 4 protein [Paracoccus sp. (in: a-proteobacteria)]
MDQKTDPIPATGRIGYVCKRYPRFSETFIVNEILAHEAAGQQLEIFSLRPSDETHFQDSLSRVRAGVTRIKDRPRPSGQFWQAMQAAFARYPQGVARLLAEPDSSFDDVFQALQLAVHVHDRGITLLHAHFATVATTVARLAAMVAGIPYSFTAHAKDIYFEYEETQDLPRKMADAAQVITVSDFNQAHLARTFGLDPSRLTRLYNGLDLDRFAWQPPKDDAAGILAVGRLVEKKGFHILIEAMLILKERGVTARCDIIGAGEDEMRLQNQIASCGLKDTVRLVGPMPQRDIIGRMRNAAVFACPCVVSRDGNRDGLPTVLVEAMALGLPVVSTDVVGIPELVRDNETGFCVEGGDPLALADAMERLLGDAALRQRLSRDARALIEAEFEINRNAARQREIFASALAAGVA